MQVLRKLPVNMIWGKIMFENAAEKLSKIVQFVTVLGMVACISLGIILGIKVESFLTLIVVSIFGSICIWINSLFIIGLLDMMDDVNCIKRLLYQIEDKKAVNSNEDPAQMNNTFKESDSQ